MSTTFLPNYVSTKDEKLRRFEWYYMLFFVFILIVGIDIAFIDFCRVIKFEIIKALEN